MQQVSLDAEKYDELLRCLSILRDICLDADIRDGIIRQRTTDAATVFEIDLTSIIGDLSIPLTVLKQKLDLLKIFSEQEVDITVEDNGSFLFSDQYSTLQFDGPDLDFMDNKYLTQEELDSIFILNDEDLILNTEISSQMSDRMRVIAQGFSVNTMKVVFNGENAALTMQTQSKEQLAKIVSDIIPERVLNCYSSLVNTPFIVDHDGDIIFKMYNFHEVTCSNVCVTSIGDVDITIYSRSALTEDD